MKHHIISIFSALIHGLVFQISFPLQAQSGNHSAGKATEMQIREIEGLDLLAFTFHTKTDTIEFLKYGRDTLQPRPSIIFLQGSLPRPLIFDLDSFLHVQLPFSYQEIIKDYNLIVISMPQTPLIAGRENLNQQYSFVLDTADGHSYSKSYLRNNFLENYVLRTKQVIEMLQDQDWVNKEDLMLIGHSQGA